MDEKNDNIEGQAGSPDGDPVYCITPKGQAQLLRERGDQLESAALDWAEARGVDLEIDRVEEGLRFTLDGDMMDVDWYWDYDDDGLWDALDDRLEQVRPAGVRCLPATLDLDDLEEALDGINTSGLYTVDLYRTSARTFRVQLEDEVTQEIEQLTLTWTPQTTRAEFLRDLVGPIEARMAAIRAMRLSAAELDGLEKLSPLDRKRAAKSRFVADRLHFPVPLASLVAAARKGQACAHWKLRNLIAELFSTPDGTLN